MQHIEKGHKYAKLTYSGNKYLANSTKGHWYYEATCDCGKIIWVRRSSVSFQESCRPCVHRTHGETNTLLYNVWAGMKGRCADISNMAYGGKGIKVCAEWLNDYLAFKKWALSTGYTKLLTIDRIDPNKGYEPNNCQWLSTEENIKRRCRPVVCTTTQESFANYHEAIRWLSEKVGEEISPGAFYMSIERGNRCRGYAFAWGEYSDTNSRVLKAE